MHGVEINCTPCDLDKIPSVEAFAEENGLLVFCGTDYHDVGRTYFGGILLPESCQVAVDMVNYIRNEGEITVFCGELQKKYRKK